MHYTVTIANPSLHYFSVELKFRADSQEQTLIIPSWTPGSYTMRDYSSHIHKIKILANGRPLTYQKLQPDAWTFFPTMDAEITVHYMVYAFQHSVRTNYLDREYGFINPAGFFLYRDNHLDESITIQFELNGWMQTVYCPLDRDHTHTIFQASNFDELYDSPFHLSHRPSQQFTVAGCQHEVIIEGAITDKIKKNLLRDLKKITRFQSKQFGKNPNSYYLFIINLTEDSYGGLEHKNSSVNAFSPFQLHKPQEYKKLLALLTHEYFHLWNVKRIRPIELGPFDYRRPNLTANLWIAEGITSFFDNYFMLKTGFFNEEEYLKELYNDIDRLQASEGEEWMSLQESSLTAWDKLYKAQENSHNTGISYYTKGAIFTLCMDIRIRKQSGGKKDFFSILPYLYQTYYLKQKRGFTLDEFWQAALSVTGVNLQKEFSPYLTKARRIPIFKYLKWLGIEKQKIETKQFPGFLVNKKQHSVIIQKIFTQYKVAKSGLHVTDELIAINNLRVNSKNYDNILELCMQDINPFLTLLVARKGKVLTIELETEKQISYQLVKKPVKNEQIHKLQDGFFLSS